MAYCKKCGAYIPDGDTKCLACGYDEKAENNKYQEKRHTHQGGEAYAHEENYEDRRRREERARRQEADRKWAQQEHERRQREQQERRKAQAEDEKAQWEEKFASEGIKSNGGKPRVHKALSIMSYISIFFILPLLFCPEDKYAKYHAKQGAVLFLFTILGEIIGSFFHVGWIFNLIRIGYMIKGIVNAASGKMEALPYIGKLAER